MYPHAIVHPELHNLLYILLAFSSICLRNKGHMLLHNDIVVSFFLNNNLTQIAAVQFHLNTECMGTIPDNLSHFEDKGKKKDYKKS